MAIRYSVPSRLANTGISKDACISFGAFPTHYNIQFLCVQLQIKPIHTTLAHEFPVAKNAIQFTRCGHISLNIRTKSKHLNKSLNIRRDKCTKSIFVLGVGFVDPQDTLDPV